MSPNDDLTVGQAGGNTVRLTAGADLKIGDAVYISDTNTVNKSTTQTNAKYFVGIVVGGDDLGGSERNVVPYDEVDYPDIGTTAALSGHAVIVQVSGIAIGVVGGTAVVKQNQLMFDTATAGRLIPGTTAGQMVGIALESVATAGASFHFLINHY
jgi:hypothetical protein